MIFTIHRYIFKELFRVFLLTTLVLTVTLSLGLMLRPIQKYGVGPVQAIHLLGYLMPITLTFILPMSALFAASLVYGRFASDNELDACRASGISLATLVYPGLSLAVIVSITTLVLSFHVVPAFVHRAEISTRDNAKHILFRNIQRKGYYVVPSGGIRIYADKANPAIDTLDGVVIVQIKKTKIKKLIKSETAKVVFDKDENDKLSNKVKIVAREVYQVDDRGRQAYFKELPVSARFPSLLSDNIKFQKMNQLKMIKEDTMNFAPIRQLAHHIRAQIITEILSGDIMARMNDGSEKYYQMVGQDKIILFSTAQCIPNDDYSIDLIGPVRLFEVDKDRHTLICRWDGDEGIIQMEDDSINARLEMVLYNPSWDTGDGLKGIAGRHAVKNLQIPEFISSQLKENKLLSSIKNMDTMFSNKPSSILLAKQERLNREIIDTYNEITSEINSRLVLGLGCVALILTGIALGIMYKGGHLLSAFGTSSIPAGALVVFIMTGKEMTKNVSISTATGTAVMWSGLVILSVLALVLYRKLLKT